MKTITFSTFALVLLLPLTACGQAPQNASPSGAADPSAQAAQDGDAARPSSMLSGEIQKAMEEAKQELATKNIDVNNIHIGDGHTNKSVRPKAEITPQGELLIAGKQVAATPAQRGLLLDYRKQIVAIAKTGMDIGKQGADLGIQASKAALWSALSGKSDKAIEETIKPQTDKIKAAALKLCQGLPALLSSQQNLAAAMPEFRPYATMEQKDVNDCGKETTDKDGKKGFATFAE